MKPIAKLTQNFIDKLNNIIESGNSSDAIKYKVMDVMLNHTEDNRDIKILFLKYLEDGKEENLRNHIKNKYPHLLNILDKMLILK